MRCLNVGNDKAVFINNNFYIVNEYTYMLLEYYYNNYSLELISSETGISSKELTMDYGKISEEINSNKYYQEEIDFKEGPIKVQWKITNKCNIECMHCYEGNKSEFQLSDNDIHTIFCKIIDSKILALTISGGEPLLVKNLYTNVFKAIKESINVKIFTNGILLDEFIDKLDSFEIEAYKKSLSFVISVDGGRKEHNKIRNSNSYDKILSNIAYAINKGYRVSTNTVINKINMESIIEMMNDLHLIGVFDIQLSNLVNKGWAIENINDLELLSEDVNKLYNEIKDKIKFDFIYTDNNSKRVYSGDSINGFKRIGNDTWKCCAGTSRFTISENGNIILCPFRDKEIIGNILYDSISDIWNNSKRLTYADNIKRINSNKKVCHIYD